MIRKANTKYIPYTFDYNLEYRYVFFFIITDQRISSFTLHFSRKPNLLSDSLFRLYGFLDDLNRKHMIFVNYTNCTFKVDIFHYFS